MKKAIFSAFLLFLVGNAAAQDTILKLDTEEIQAKIEEISQTEIKYRRWSNPDGPLYTVKTSEVFRIRFQNGDMEVFGNKEADVTESESGSVNKYAYRIGDIYQENGLLGIVVHVTDDGRHGLIMAPHGVVGQKGSRFRFKDQIWCHKGLAGQPTGATNHDDGMENMRAVGRAIEENGLSWNDFPAFKRCLEYGDGWYLPAINEVEYIVKAANGGNSNTEWKEFYLNEFNSKIESIGGTPMKIGESILSSTECSGPDKVFIFLSKGEIKVLTLSIFDLIPDYYTISSGYAYKEATGKMGYTIRPVHKF